MLKHFWGYLREWWETCWGLLLLAACILLVVILSITADDGSDHISSDYPVNAHPVTQEQYDTGPSSDAYDKAQEELWRQQAIEEQAAP